MSHNKFIESLIEERNNILQQAGVLTVVQNLDNLIEYYRKGQEPPKIANTKAAPKSNKRSDYSKNWKLADKIKFVLLSNKRFLHVREIADEIEARDNVIKKQEGFSNTISGTFARLRKLDENIAVYHPGGHPRKAYWGNKLWLDASGKPLTEHTPIIIEEKNEVELN